MTSKFFRILLINPIIFALLLISCGKPGDARKIPPNYKDRVRQNIEEGRGFRLMGGEKRNIGDFDFAFLSSIRPNLLIIFLSTFIKNL